LLWEGSVTRPDRTFLGSFVPILTKKNRNTIIRKDVRNVKITRSGSIILTSFLIAASIVLFAAAGIILDKPATQMQLEQQTAQAQSSTDIVVGTTAETPENVSVTIIFCGDRKPVEPPQTTVTTAKPEEPVATIKSNCGNIQRKKPPEKVIILPPSKEKSKPEPCPKPHPTTTTTLPKCELPGTSPKSTIGDKDKRHTPPAKLEDPPHNDTYIDGSGGGTASDGDETITDNTGTHVVPNDSPPHSGNSGGIMPQ